MFSSEYRPRTPSVLSHKLYFDFEKLNATNLELQPDDTVYLLCDLIKARCRNGLANFNPELGIATNFTKPLYSGCPACLKENDQQACCDGILSNRNRFNLPLRSAGDSPDTDTTSAG